MKKNIFFNLIIGATVLLFSCNRNSDPVFNNSAISLRSNCDGDVSIQYEMESTNSAVCISKSDASKLTPIENIYAMPRTDRVKVDVCYFKDGSYTMNIENIKPKGTTQYPDGTLGVNPNPTFSKAIISNGNVKIYDAKGILMTTTKDDDVVAENKRLVERILKFKPIDKSEMEKLVPVLTANGLVAQESSDKKYISWKQPNPNGGFSINVIDKSTAFLAGIEVYDAKSVRVAQTIIRAEIKDSKINLKGFLLTEDFVTPFSKTPMKKMYNSIFENFSLNTK